MRVLHIGKYYPPCPGGMENFLGDLLRALMGEGVAVSALVHHHISGRPSCSENDGGIEIHRARFFGQVLYAPLSPSFPRLLRLCIRDFRPHLLHFHFPNPSAFWSFLVPEARSIPWIIQWQGDVVPSTIDRRLQPAYKCYRPFEQAFLRRTKKIIATSRDYLEYSGPLKKWTSKCCVVSLGIDPERLPWPEEADLRRAEKTWRSGALKVLAVGRLTYYKGFDVLLRAADRCPGISVQIVGGGALRSELQREIGRRGIEERVTLRGELSNIDLQALLATCNLLCLPSIERSEAFGIVLLEAMRYGKALVVSDIPGSGTGWVVRTGSCGFLVPPGDAGALTKVFERLISQPSLCQKMGKKGSESLQQTFHIRFVARQIKEIYARTIGESRD